MIEKIRGYVYPSGTRSEVERELNNLKQAIDDCLADPTKTLCIPCDTTIDEVVWLCKTTGLDKQLIAYGKKIGLATAMYWCVLTGVVSLSILSIVRWHRQRMKDSTKVEESK